jgi:hypothetical protein
LREGRGGRRKGRRRGGLARWEGKEVVRPKPNHHLEGRRRKERGREQEGRKG